MKLPQIMWRWWAKSLGQKASDCDRESDKVAIIRTIIFMTYLITNCFIVAGVIRHWNDREINVEVQIYENPESNQNTHPERWDNLGMGRDTRVKRIHPSAEFYSGWE